MAKEVKYNLQQWVPERPGERFGGAAHWRSCFFYTQLREARRDRNRFNRMRGMQPWRIIKIVKEEIV
jgi:hypothetical protein